MMKKKSGITVFGSQGLGRLFVLLAIISMQGGCGQSDGPDPGPPVQPESKGKAQVWLTSGDQSRLLSKQSDINLTSLKLAATVTLDSTIKYQEIEGFGAALTGSSAYLMDERMSDTQRATLINDLFDREDGIGISYIRVTMGASDFSLSDYTYNDMPSGQTDYPLANFTIAKDKEDVVPVLKEIVGVAPSLNIMATPWSPPAWMKSNGSLEGGKLKTDAYESYANYFVKYIKAYAAEGIAIDAVTPQNEPLYSTASYPCTDMPAADQLSFIKNNLGPTFQAENIDAKIIVYDHNWDNTTYAISILDDAAAAQYVAGSAFHAYAGNVSAMTTVHVAHPDKGLYFTEISGGAWAENFSDNLQWNMSNIFIGTTQNWSKTALLWNLALDESHGPTNGGCSDCRGVVTINSATGTVTKNVEYYSIGHFSKFVRPGAVRINTTFNQSISGVNAVTFLNTDGSKAMVVQNSGDNQATLTITLGQRQFVAGIPGKSVATIVWN